MRTTITLEGNLGSDPKIGTTKAGKIWMSLNVAVTERVRTPEGEWEDGTTTWFNVKVWGGQAERIADHVHKGSKVLVTGRFEMSEWQTEDGEVRSTPTVHADGIAVVPRAQRSDAPAQPRQERRPAPEPPLGYDDEAPF